MTSRKKQTIILITATTLGMSNVVNSYAFVHAQDIPQTTALQVNTKATNDIYNEHGDLLINETTFPDPYFRDYVNRVFANGSGVLTQMELDNIESINVVYPDGTAIKYIKSVKGIAYFPNLRYLNLSNTALTTLDVSKNTELKVLYVANTPLKVLELRHNKKLTEVDATGVQLAYFYWDELENIDAYKNFKIDSKFHHTIYSLSSTVDLTKIYPGLDPSKMVVDRGVTFQEGKLSNFKYDTPIKLIIDITIYNPDPNGQQAAVQGEIYFTIKEGLAIDDINFPDQEFQQYVRQFDTDTDGIFNQAELDAVTNISVRGNKDIDNLQGIEHFANLTSLDCSQTNISALDVHNNKKLQYLYCFKTKIKELNVNENKLLDTLNCADNKELDTLEISGATALIRLNCNNTSIGTLNTQENVHLEKLDCGYTLLGNLKLEKNEKLTYLNMPLTQIENLDISKQKLLETLIISGNDIDSLDVSYLHNLKYLSISNTPIRELNLTQNVNLDQLLCFFTRLSGLDLSYNNKLSRLDTDYSPLTWINFGTSNPNTLTWYNAPPDISVDTTQPYINLKDYAGIDISKIDKDSIAGGVLHESYLYYNKSGEAVSYMYDAGTVGGVAQKLEVKLIPNEVGVKVDATNFPDPKFLAYVENNIDKNGSGVLTTDEINAVLSINLNNSAYTSVTNLKGIEHFPNLKQLWLENTAISSLETYDLSKITHLSIKNTSIDSLRVENLPNLILLDISGTKIPSLVLTGNTKLETFYGAVSDLRRLDVHGLTSLQTLDVQQSKMFSSLNIEGCSGLTSLYLNRTIIDKLDVSDAINLKNLNIEYTLISNINLQANKILNSLAVGYMENLTDIDLSKNTLLTYLNCSGSPLKRLSLDTNNQLKSLYCTDTQLTSLSLEKNTLLETLVCYNNPGITSLDLRNNTNLKDLQIYGMNLSHLYLGTNDSVNINGGQSSTTSVLQVTVDGPSFDITKIIPGIEISRINNFEGADRNGTLIEGYQPNKPITYSYTTNDSTGNPFTLHVTLVLTINPLDRTVSFQKDFNKNKKYDGTEVTISSNDIDMPGDKSLLSYTWEKLENNTWVDMNEAPVHAGVYRVSAHAEADDFYKEALSQPKQVIISQAQNEWTTIPSITGWIYGEYDANKNAPIAVAKFGQYDVTYKDAQGNIVTTTPKDAGAWTMVVSVPETEDYRGISKEVPFTIHKASAPALVLPENLSAVHGDVLSNIVLPKGWTWVNGQETVSIRKLSYTARFMVDDKNYDYTNVPGYNANGGYVEHEIVLSISKATNTWLEAPFMEDWTYGETAIEPTGKAAYGKVEVSYSNAKDGTFTKDVPTEAGNWFVKLQVPTSVEYTGLEEILSFTIHKAPAPALVLPDNLNAIHSDELSTITLPKGWAWVNGQEIISVNKTGYAARFTVDDKNYDYSKVAGYNANGHYVEVELTVVVSKIVNTWTETPSMDDWTYGEQAIQPIGKAAHGDVEVTYSNAKYGTFTKDVPTEAGNWFVKLQVPSSAEYTGLEEILPFTISKAPAPALVLPENLTALHGDILSNIVLPNGWTWVDGQERVSVHKANYTARFAVVDDKNYDYSKVPGYDVNGHYVEVELSVVVSKLNNTWTETPSMDDWTYGETAKEPKGKAAHGDVEVTYSNAKDGTFTKDIPTEAGNWFMKLHVPASAEYTGLEEILPFTIKRAVAPALILPENLSAAHDDTLSSISLPTGWTWANGQEKVSVHKLSYTARFAVDDKNYDYTNIPGYNANGHYVEHEIVVAVSQGTNTWKVTPSIYDWTYGETAAEPKGEAMHNTTSITYSDKIDGDFTKDVPVQAGNWFMKVSAPASAEYTGIEEILPFTIHKAQAPALNLPENLSAVHDDTLSSISLPTGWTWANGQEKVSVHKLSYTARFAVDDKNYDYSNVSGYNAGGHYVEVAIQLHVSQADNTWTTTPSIANWTYGEQPVQPTGKAAHGEVEVTYSDAMDGTFTKDVPTEAGNWFVKFLVPASAEYAGLETVLPFTIHQAQAPALVLPENLSALHGDALSSIKLPDGWYWVDTQGSVAGNVKTYLARCIVDDKNYDYTAVPGYNATGHYVEVKLTILIAQQSNQWIEKPSIADWTLGETPAQPSGKAEHGDVVFTYSNAIDGMYVNEQPTKPGTWYMKASVNASEAYLGLEEIVTFKILPKEDIVKDTDVAQASGLWTIVLASIVGLLSCFTRKKHGNKK